MSNSRGIPGFSAAGDARRYKAWVIEQAHNERVSGPELRLLIGTAPMALMDAAQALSNLRVASGMPGQYGISELCDHLRRVTR